MKHIFLHALRCLMAAGVLLFLANIATAQRTDSLTTKTDVILPYSYVGSVTFKGAIYYLADDGKTGYELWRTDGTKAGTRILKDINPGKSSAFVSDSSYYNFGDYNNATYKYDINPTKVKDALRYVKPYVFKDSLLYFWADNGTNGIELWQSDGTEANTRMTVDLVPGPFSTGNQADILYATYYVPYYGSFSIYQNKLLFNSQAVPNVYWLTDGKTTTELSPQATKYKQTSTNLWQSSTNGLYLVSSFADKGKPYYTIFQADAKLALTPVIVNSVDSPTLLTTDSRGFLYYTQKDNGKLLSFFMYRNEGGKDKLLKQIDLTKPTTGTRSQYVSFIGNSDGQYLFRVLDEPAYQQSGKGTHELWRIDAKTDETVMVKRLNMESTFANNTTTYLKGSQRIATWYTPAAGALVVQQTADSTGTAYTSSTLGYVDGKTNAWQALEETVRGYPQAQTYKNGKILFITQKDSKDAFRVWLTDGRMQKTLKTLKPYGGIAFFNSNSNPATGTFPVVTYSDLKVPKVGFYQIEVLQIDTTAAGIVQTGQSNKFNGGVTSTFSLINTGSAVYSNVYDTFYKLTSAPSDSIRPVAAFNNYNTLLVPNTLGTINGRVVVKRTADNTLIAIDPAAAPRRCDVAYTSKTRASTYYNTKELGYCPAKDSVITLKQQLLNYPGNTGDVLRIYHNTLQWLRDSTVLQSGSIDSLKLRQQGQYALSLRGIADGCTATDTWQVYFSAPTVTQIPKLSGDRKVLAGVVTGGYPYNGSTGYYSGKWERTTADGAISQASTETNFNAATGFRSVATAALDESVSNVYQPKYGTYTLKITDANSCSATGTYNYTDKTVILGLATTIGLRNGADVCAGTPVSYTASASGGKAPYTYRWIRNGAPASGVITATGSVSVNSDVLNTDFNGYFSIEATDADGNKTYSNDQILFVHAAPAIALIGSSPTIPAGQSVTLTANCTNYQYPTYAWAKDNAVVSGVASKTLSATQAGVYSVTVGSGDKYGCITATSLQLKAGAGRVAASASSEPVSRQGLQILSVETGLNAEGKAEAILQIMPNPSEGPTRVRLELPEPAAIKGQVVDAQGRVIQRWEEPKSTPVMDRIIDLGPQPVGPYIIQVEADGKVHSEKVIKK